MRTTAVRLLLVEDDLDDLVLFEEALLEIEEKLTPRLWMKPCQCLPVERLAEALDALAHENFDAILLDSTLPDATAVDAFLRLRSIVPAVPIVVLTATEDEAMGISLVRQGAEDYLVKAEIEPVLLARSLRCAIERHRLRNALVGLTLIDDLTGLYSPGGFLHLADRLLALARLTSHTFHLVLIEIKGLDAVHETFGFEERDMTLLCAAEKLRECTSQTDVLGRLGPDRFALASIPFPGVSDNPLPRRLHTALDRINGRGGGACRIRPSFGVASLDPTDETPLDALLRAAECSLASAVLR